ncbi:MAG: hypothetical protein P1V13_22330 [Rhizobiaceae bacterium]|nr:hypothetical protein [Rhizobiaceae bacterium]
MLRNPPNAGQGDLFAKPVFESRTAVPILDADRFRLRIKSAMSEAISKRQLDRHAVASGMARSLNAPGLSKTMLDAYTSPAKDHDISLVRFKALVRTIDAPELWDVAVSDDGLLVLRGDEARLAEIARLQQEQRALGDRLRKLRSTPVNIKRGAK